MDIRERKKEKDTFHATFLISLKKTNNSENVALSKFNSSLWGVIELSGFAMDARLAMIFKPDVFKFFRFVEFLKWQIKWVTSIAIFSLRTGQVVFQNL